VTEPRKSARILVVDDDEHVLRAMATSLRRAGFDVTTASDIAPALAMNEPFDVVLADFHMQSEVTGADIVRHFKSLHGAGITCFVLSGEDDPETRDACFAAGAADVLLKPISPVELRRRLGKARATRIEAA
jgi:two-component system OmpR family response regulator